MLTSISSITAATDLAAIAGRHHGATRPQHFVNCYVIFASNTCVRRSRLQPFRPTICWLTSNDSWFRIEDSLWVRSATTAVAQETSLAIALVLGRSIFEPCMLRMSSASCESNPVGYCHAA